MTQPIGNDPLPASVEINAWPGEPAIGALADDAQNWRTPGPAAQPAAPPLPPARRPDPVGRQGLLDIPDAKWAKEKVTGTSAPAPIQELLAARPTAQLLYWRAALADRYLRRYFDDGTASDLQIGMTRFGIAKDRLPRYVLIVGQPDTIPWSVQYSLSIRHAVGRLPLHGDDLGPYVSAMLDGEDGWASTPTDVTAPVVWTVDHGSLDITRLMRSALTAPLVKAFTGTLAGLIDLNEKEATGSALVTALAASPTVVVSSSHGATPLDQTVLPSVLGLPVDAGHATVPLDELTAAMPAGIVWFAQACCSAGSSAPSSFSDLLAAGTTARAVVDAVAALGPTVAPAPLALLAREHPARAVLGHVEPTFGWTLKDPQNNQKFGGDLVLGLSSNLHHGQPLGLAFADYRAGVGILTSTWVGLAAQLNRDHDRSVLPTMTRLRLTAWDRQSLVLLGDPTVRIPPLP
jgi:hypothetical protein